MSLFYFSLLSFSHYISSSTSPLTLTYHHYFLLSFISSLLILYSYLFNLLSYFLHFPHSFVPCLTLLSTCLSFLSLLIPPRSSLPSHLLLSYLIHFLPLLFTFLAFLSNLSPHSSLTFPHLHSLLYSVGWARVIVGVDIREKHRVD